MQYHLGETGYFGTGGDDDFSFPENENGGFAFMQSGNDRVQGSSNVDIIGAGPGNDTIFGGGHADQVFGGDGNDQVYGDGGEDTLFGGDGNDTVGGGADNDMMWAGDGNDVAFGGNGEDTIGGGAGDDTIWGGDGDDTIYGGSGDNTLGYEGEGLQKHHFDIQQIVGGGYRIDDGHGNVDTVYGKFGHIVINGNEYDWADFFQSSEPFDPGVITRDPDGTLDPVAIDGDEPYHGDGNDEHNWSIARNETHGLEAGLQIKERGGDAYDPDSVDADGTVHWIAPSGEGAAGRAVWNWDYSVASTDGDPLTDYTVKMFVDMDPSDAVDYMQFDAVPGPATDGGAFVWEVNGNPAIVDDGGNAFVSQNSQNLGFYEQFMDMDDGTPGIQPYNFSEAEIDILLQVADMSGNVLLENHGVVHVEDMTSV